MANYSASAALRAQFAATGRPSVHREHPFTDDVWRLEQRLREAVDTLLWPVRWHCTVIPGDRITRHFFLRGTHTGVTARALAFFPDGVVLVEPAHIQHAPEVIDRRLSLSTLEK